MRSLCTVVLLACFPLASFAQAPTQPSAPGVKTDRAVYPLPPAPQLPKAGGTFTDPTFGTTIMRVTDETDGKDNHVAYSYWPTFNKDSTRIFYASGGQPMTATFDPVGFVLGIKERIFDKPTPARTSARWEDAIWSGQDPNVIFAHDSQCLWQYDLGSRQFTLVKDFRKDLGHGIKQMSRSIDDNVFAFTTTDDKGESGFTAWQRKGDKVLLKAEGRELDEVQVDKSGQWLLVKTSKQGKGVIQAKVANLHTGEIVDLIDDEPDYAPGHSDNGTGFCIGADNWQNRFTRREFQTPHQFKSILDLKGDWSQGTHLSLLADNEDWCVISFYEWTKPAAKPGPFHNEIVQVATDGSQRVRRLAHHRSILNGDYWSCPFANASRDGRFIAYSANYNGTGQRDVFILRVPD